MSFKQDELEVLVSFQSCNIISISETWWDESHDWSAGMESRSGRIARADELEVWHYT